MRAPRIHTSQSLSPGGLVELDSRAANYVVRVLRLHSGDPLVLFNGEGGEYPAILERAERQNAWARLQERVDHDNESPLRVVLVQGISKGERMDYTIQKAVELGVAEIVPVFTRRSVVQLNAERAAKRQQHWQGVAISACEQCGRNRVPTVSHPVSLQTWLDGDAPRGLGLIMDPLAQSGLTGVSRSQEMITVLAGPEGGLEPGELEAASTKGFQGVSLGPRILRTETASLAMLAALQTLWGDLG
jgi:16S rRNA (uracil1498-N3)-methyltransferase